MQLVASQENFLLKQEAGAPGTYVPGSEAAHTVSE